MNKLHKIFNNLLVETGGANFVLKSHNASPVILFYHGVSKHDTKPDDKHINYVLFKDQLLRLKKYFDFLSVEELTDTESFLRTRKRPVLSVTFDDGYKNNHNLAAEILKELNIPATFFISTGYIETQRWMWTDLLEYSIDHSKTSVLDVDELNIHMTIKTGQEKEAALALLKSELKKLDYDSLYKIVPEISNQLLQGDQVAPFGDYEFMNWDDIRSLRSAGFGIGAHTINHPILSRISVKQAEHEINGSREILLDRVGYCSDVFCYPNGKKSDYTDDVIKICKSRYKAALTTNYGNVMLDNMYELNRVGISNLLQGNKIVRRLVNQAITD